MSAMTDHILCITAAAATRYAVSYVNPAEPDVETAGWVIYDRDTGKHEPSKMYGDSHHEEALWRNGRNCLAFLATALRKNGLTFEELMQEADIKPTAEL